MSKIKKNETIERKIDVVCIPCPNPSILEIDSKKPYFDKTEFTKSQLKNPGKQFNSNQANKRFLHTYVWKPENRCCQVLKAHIQVKMTSLRPGTSLNSSDAGNDNISIVKNGGIPIVPTERIYSGSSFSFATGEAVTKNYVLTGSQLDWLNSAHKLSFYVQDDTSVNWIRLRLEICCLKKVKRSKGKV